MSCRLLLFFTCLCSSLIVAAQNDEGTPESTPIYEQYKSLTKSFYSTQTDSSLHYCKLWGEAALVAGDSTSYGSAINKLGLIFKKKGVSDSAFHYLFLALDIRTTMGDSARMGSSYENIAAIYKNREEPQTALNYYYKSLAIKKPLGVPKWIAGTYNGLGSTYRQMGQSDSALHYLQLALPIYEEINAYGKSTQVQFNIGNVHFEDSAYHKALEIYTETLASYRELESLEGEAQALNNIASCHKELGEFALAASNYRNAIARYHEASYGEGLDDAYLNLAQTYTSLGEQANANTWYERYVVVHDSMNSLATEEYIATLEERILNVQLETDLQVQEAENERIAAEDATKATTIWILVISLVALALVLWFYYRNQRNKKRLHQREVEFKEQELAMKRQEIDKLLKRQEIKSYSAMLMGQDDERKRIAEDLHDRLGSTLSTVKLHFQTVEEQLEHLKIENTNHYDKASSMLDEAVAEVRKIAHSLSIGVLSEYGLKVAVTDLVETITASDQIAVKCFLEGLKGRYESSIEIELYRIIQELFSNVFKHAFADEIVLQINDYENTLTITFEDNGIGFDPKEKGHGIGFQNISSRLLKLQGKMDVDSQKGHGTTVIIEIPLPDDTTSYSG